MPYIYIRINEKREDVEIALRQKTVAINFQLKPHPHFNCLSPNDSKQQTASGMNKQTYAPWELLLLFIFTRQLAESVPSHQKFGVQSDADLD